MGPDGDLIEFLLKPESYPEKPSSVVHRETHISHVFIAGPTVYKVKKPVDFGFLNFTTLARRRFYCREEVKLNSRLAPDVYLGVVPLYRKGNAYAFLRSRGAVIVEYAVKMKRIPEEKLLSHLIGEGKLLYGALAKVSEALARFHKEAAIHRRGPYGGIETVRANTEENFDQIEPYRGVTVAPEFYARLVSSTHLFLKERGDLFRERKERGFVREVHGDLHTEHLCLTNPPIILDCIEFNARFRISDVLEDMAFLFMDLEYRGRFDLSAAVSHAYFSHFPDNRSAELLLFYKTYRAVVRGKIEGFTADGLKDDPAGRDAALRRAKDYYGLAQHYVEHAGAPFNPVVLMGVSGSGKSELARDLLPGAVVLRSDEVRKRLAGVPASAHVYVDYDSGLYDPATTIRTYRAMTREAVAAAEKGKRVVVDATFLASGLRKEFYETSVREGLNPFFVRCVANEHILRERVQRRMEGGADVSDARLDVLERQLRIGPDADDLPSFRVMKVDTGDDEPETVRRALRLFL
jgi:aminoglycoside phosphotransferase family enzyme/predicted kinase